MVRLAPIPPSAWSGDLASFIFSFRAEVIGEEAAAGGGPSGANLLGTLARHPALTKQFLNFNGHVLNATTLTARQRELLVLRVAAIRRCDYEWAQHVILAEKAGMRSEEIERIVEGPDAPGWTAVERALLSAVDELIAGAEVSAGTWRVLADEFDDRQLLDIVFTVGTYEMVAFVLRSFAIEPDGDLAPYLPARSAASGPAGS